METVDGRDITPLLQGVAMTPLPIAVTEFPWSKSVRKGKYRLVYYARASCSPTSTPRDSANSTTSKPDPWEMTNLFFDPAYQDTVREMTNDLLDWLIVTARPTTIHPAAPATSVPVPEAVPQRGAGGW